MTRWRHGIFIENSCIGAIGRQDSRRPGEAPITTPIEFYFDFISPYGFFAATRIDAIAAKYGRTVRWRPFNLRPVAMAVGFDKPMVGYPIKGPYFMHDVPRMARLYGIAPWQVADMRQVNPAVAGRAFYWAADQDEHAARQLALGIYRKLYCEATDASRPAEIASMLTTLGLDGDAWLAAADSAALKARYKQITEDAMAEGVFGSPYIVVDGEPFWGSDRLWMVEKWLADGGW
ncbi:2-hydroxychromene-2-carboxylate isomerase [Iodidimonas sp. SYSU 1G8]|uniref:2-hydroxychromene-2-carboxylate isomerase n=1 Tax=Iodidimonas sp. SYSU 1G8 TaxID=3133967 RepID=UPI0031FEFA0C